MEAKVAISDPDGGYPLDHHPKSGVPVFGPPCTRPADAEDNLQSGEIRQMSPYSRLV
jgi:hypothetical protein